MDQQARRLGLMSLACSASIVLLHTRLLQSGRYWRHGGVYQWDSPKEDLGFRKPFGGLTREFSDLGFEHRTLAYIAYISLAMGGMHWRRGDMFLHICHLPWVAHTGDLVGCLWAYVTHRGWHVLESQWCALTCMSLAVGGTYWSRDENMLLHVCHSSSVTHTGYLVVCSCIYASYEVARTGDLITCCYVHVTRRMRHALEA